MLGSLGEFMSFKILNSYGYKVIFRNYYTKYGEIDLIAVRSKTIYFIESKLTTSAYPSSVLKKWQSKQRQGLKQAINIFISKNKVYFDFSIQILLIHFDFSQKGMVKLASYKLY